MSRIVGIDLGTTNSLVAYLDAGGIPRVIPDAEGRRLLPSIVAYTPNGIVVGEAARRQLARNPARTIYSVKRFMGRGGEDVREEARHVPFEIAPSDEVVRIRVGDREVTPPEVSAEILRTLKQQAEAHFGEPVDKAVITVPAYFNDAQRQATKDASRIAGLEVLRLVNEPTAASLAYGLDKKRDGIVAVYDLGGGTFDVSILKLHEGIFEVVATNGDTHLGGDDIDNLLITIALDDIRGDLGMDLRRNAEAVQAIRKAVIEAKIALSAQESVTVEVELPKVAGGTPALRGSRGADGGVRAGREGDETVRYQRAITRVQFEELMEPIVQRTVGPCRQALKDAGLAPAQIDEVVLVGGSTRIPRVRRLVQELFQRVPHAELNPDEVVALGAAVQANILSGGSQATKDMLLLDVTPLSLGIEALGGVVAKIIHRNSTIPASATEHFTTGVEGQTSVAIHVLQGERELAGDNRSLARFELRGIPPMPAGLPRIEVRLLIDANGILHVSAREQRSGKEAEIEVKPTYGLTDEQVENMILESFDYAEEDFRKRQVAEAQVEADNILLHVAKAKQSAAWRQLSTDERRTIGQLEAALTKALGGSDYKVIRSAIDKLNHETTHLAELMMDTAVTSALQGKTMESAGDEMGEGPDAPHRIAPAEFT